MVRSGLTLTIKEQSESTTSHLSLLRGEAFGTESRVGGDSLVSGGDWLVSGRDSVVSGGISCCRDTRNPSPRIIQQQRDLEK